MKTYPTFAEAKIDNPTLDIFKLPHSKIIEFYAANAADVNQHIQEYKCNPADYCSTVGELWDLGHRLEKGDIYMDGTGKLWRCEWPGVSNCRGETRVGWHVIKAAAFGGGSKIPEKKDEPQWSDESLPPVRSWCEISNKDAKHWVKCLVMGYFEDLVWLSIHPDGNVAVHKTEVVNTLKFRPLKTPEQVEVEELAYELYKADCKRGGIKTKLFDKVVTEKFFESYIVMATAAIKHIKGE